MDEALREFVRQRASDRCEYCLLPQSAARFFTFHVEHIRAKQHGGQDIESNLALACPDFEDNIQLVSAESIAVNHLITRNKKDFDAATISVLNPEERLALQEVATLEAKLTPPPGP